MYPVFAPAPALLFGSRLLCWNVVRLAPLFGAFVVGPLKADE